jgi:hypothetical protein
MKKIAIIFLVFISTMANAQKYNFENDGRILENGVHVAKFEKTSDAITIIVNLDEDELINIEQASDDELKINYNIITFSDANNSVAYLREQKKGVNILDVILRTKVLKGGALQDDAIKQFCAANVFDALQKKAFAKQQKEDAKIEKNEAKKELDEDKEFEKDEKLIAKETKKENVKEARQEKKELLADKRQEKKDEIVDNKNSKKEVPEIDEKTTLPASKEGEVSLVLEKGMIIYGKKIIGKYAELEGLVKGKKGQTITIYNKENKRVAMVKQQYDAQEANIIDTKTNAASLVTLYSNTKENKMMEIIFKVLEMKLL